jgi:hypothetical protein
VNELLRFGLLALEAIHHVVGYALRIGIEATDLADMLPVELELGEIHGASSIRALENG